jgi:hypothetical protein
VRKIKRWPAGIHFSHPSAERDFAIECIIKETGKQPDSRERLARDIYLARAAFAIIELSSRDRRAKRTKLTRPIRQTIKKLEEQIANPQISRIIGNSLNPKKAAANIDRFEGRHISIEKVDSKRQPSATEWLAGLLLPTIYEERFGSRAKFRRVDDIPAGPVIFFVQTVLIALGVIDVDRHYIGRAISRLRKAQNTRRMWRDLLRLGKERKN